MDPELLHASHLIDCQGRVTHTLTLLLDGRVQVRSDRVTATIDPVTRQVLPYGARLGGGEYGHEQLVDAACAMATLWSR